MDNRYIGELGTSVYGLSLNEMRIGHINYPATATVASDADGILAAFELGAAGLAATEFLKQPPVARNLTIVASDTQTGKVTVYGHNIAGEPIEEEFTLESTTPVVGAKAFKTVTKIVLPVKVGAETIDVGWGELIGLPVMLSAAPLCWLLDDGVADTAPSFTVDGDELEKNTFDFDGALDGSVLDLFLVL